MSANVEAFTSWSTTLTNNQPTSTDTADLVSDLTKIQAEVRKFTRTVATPMASATTLNLATADGDYVAVTGTTTITGLGTVSAGIRFILKFDGALTFTHNATSLILPGAANITTAAGDIACMESLGSGNWRCLFYTKATGSTPSLTASGGSALVGHIDDATGAVATTVQAKLREWVSLKDFGAVGDGTTDDTAAINLAIAAINDATVTGLYVPPGKYQITSALDAITVDGWAIRGAGWGVSKFAIDVTATTLSTFFTIGDLSNKSESWSISDLWLENENITTMGATNPIVIVDAAYGIIENMNLRNTCGFITFGTSTTVAQRIKVSNFDVRLHGLPAGTVFDINYATGLNFTNGNVAIIDSTGADNLKGIHIHPSTVSNVIDSHKWTNVEFNFPSTPVNDILVIDATTGIIVNQAWTNCVFDHANDSCIKLVIGAGATATSRMNNLFFNGCRATADTLGPVVVDVDTSNCEIQNLEFNGGTLITYGAPCVTITQQAQQEVRASFVGVALQDTEYTTARAAIQSDYGNIRVVGCIAQSNVNASTCAFDYGVKFTAAAQDFIVAGNDFNSVTIADVDVSTLATSGQENKIIANNIGPKRSLPAAVQTTDATQTILMAQTLNDDSVFTVRATVNGVTTDGANRASYEIIGTFYRTATGNATQVGTTTVLHSAESDSAWACVFAVSTTVVQVRVTGAAATTINWTGKMEFARASE